VRTPAPDEEGASRTGIGPKGAQLDATIVHALLKTQTARAEVGMQFGLLKQYWRVRTYV
jgi:hypothetical protein